MENNQIMLSVHCASMLTHAERLRVFLVGEGYTVFLCSEMQAGVNYRQAICENAAKCKVFVAFINHGWCKSTECEFEFNIALAQSLKSPVKTPYIIPILLEEFSFYDDYPVVVGLLKNAQGIAAKTVDLDTPLWSKVHGIISNHRALAPANPPVASPHRVPVHATSTLKPSATNAKQAPNAKLAPNAKPAPPRNTLAPTTTSTSNRSPSPTPQRMPTLPTPTPTPTTAKPPFADSRVPIRSPTSQPSAPASTATAPGVFRSPALPPRSPIATSGNIANPSPTPNRQPTSPVPASPHEFPALPSPPTYPAYVMNLPPVPPTDLEALRVTALQLIQDILNSRIKIGGATTFAEVKTTLERLAPTSDTETSLRALMDFLSKIKEICAAAQSTGGTFPYLREMLATLKKLETIVKDPNHTTLFVAEFIADEETREFWERFFGKNEYSVTWPRFARALVSDAHCGSIISEEDTADILQDLLLNVDHYNTGHVVCHRLADFVGSESLTVALQKYSAKPQYRLPASLHFPLLLWIDDFPENNNAMTNYAREIGIHVVHMDSTAAAKEWLKQNEAVLTEQKQVHIITDNVRTGANTVLDLNAGEDIIRFVRGRRSKVPILVYCGDLNYAKYVARYAFCSAGNQAMDCQLFIEKLVPQ